MALYDNKYWLLSHIRNSFMSTDDTGMCEVVMVGETQEVKDKFFSQEAFADPDDSEDDEEDDETGSYDLQMDADFGIRDRSMTAARLEKLENNKKANKMRHIKWEPRGLSMEDSNESFEDLFVKEAVQPVETQVKQKSGLSSLIEQYTHLPLNPYMEYARFDGSGQVNIPTRKYRIFLTMLPEEQRHYPLSICCIATAKIQDLIGLILLKFSTHHSDVTLKPVLNYGLYITEEDGEVDSDFPNLDPKECVAKFGFTCLGLVEHKEPLKTVSFDTTEEILSSPDSGGGKKRTTSSSKAEESKQLKNDMKIMDGHNRAMEAPMYKSYRVHIVNKLRWWNMEVHIGISSEKIEIDPISQKNTKLQLVKQLPMSHPMDTIAWCQEQETRGNKTTFIVVYACGVNGKIGERMHTYPNTLYMSSLQSSPSFKHYDFEADKEVAEEIVNKINMILNFRSSPCRREYVAAKERKRFTKKRSFKSLK